MAVPKNPLKLITHGPYIECQSCHCYTNHVNSDDEYTGFCPNCNEEGKELKLGELARKVMGIENTRKGNSDVERGIDIGEELVTEETIEMPKDRSHLTIVTRNMTGEEIFNAEVYENAVADCLVDLESLDSEAANIFREFYVAA